MNLDTYTVKAQTAVQDAFSMAERNGNNVDCDHLLFSLLMQKDGRFGGGFCKKAEC